ncbi:hypothetical protein, partial [Plesiomonas shigelloides]
SRCKEVNKEKRRKSVAFFTKKEEFRCECLEEFVDEDDAASLSSHDDAAASDDDDEKDVNGVFTSDYYFC